MFIIVIDSSLYQVMFGFDICNLILISSMAVTNIQFACWPAN